MRQWSELFVVAEFVVAEFAVVEFAVAEFGMWEKCGLLVLESLDVHLTLMTQYLVPRRPFCMDDLSRKPVALHNLSHLLQA